MNITHDESTGITAFLAEPVKRWPKYSGETRKDRFLSKINRNGPIPEHRPELGSCWIWEAGKFKSGYGQFFHFKAHRVAFTIKNGEIPPSLNVCHSCDNPPCCNPAHLWLGTDTENMADRDLKCRQASGDRCGSVTHIHKRPRGDMNPSRRHPERLSRGDTHKSAKLTEAKVRVIRERFSEGEISMSDLAREYGVTHGAISHVVKWRTWKIYQGQESPQFK